MQAQELQQQRDQHIAQMAEHKDNLAFMQKQLAQQDTHWQAENELQKATQNLAKQRLLFEATKDPDLARLIGTPTMQDSSPAPDLQSGGPRSSISGQNTPLVNLGPQGGSSSLERSPFQSAGSLTSAGPKVFTTPEGLEYNEFELPGGIGKVRVPTYDTLNKIAEKQQEPQKKLYEWQKGVDLANSRQQKQYELATGSSLENLRAQHELERAKAQEASQQLIARNHDATQLQAARISQGLEGDGLDPNEFSQIMQGIGSGTYNVESLNKQPKAMQRIIRGQSAKLGLGILTQKQQDAIAAMDQMAHASDRIYSFINKLPNTGDNLLAGPRNKAAMQWNPSLQTDYDNLKQFNPIFATILEGNPGRKAVSLLNQAQESFLPDLNSGKKANEDRLDSLTSTIGDFTHSYLVDHGFSEDQAKRMETEHGWKKPTVAVRRAQEMRDKLGIKAAPTPKVVTPDMLGR
jgi:hypothetical protein